MHQLDLQENCLDSRPYSETEVLMKKSCTEWSLEQRTPHTCSQMYHQNNPTAHPVLSTWRKLDLIFSCFKLTIWWNCNLEQWTAYPRTKLASWGELGRIVPQTALQPSILCRDDSIHTPLAAGLLSSDSKCVNACEDSWVFNLQFVEFRNFPKGHCTPPEILNPRIEILRSRG